MANLDRMTDRPTLHAFRQQFQEAREIFGIEFFGRHELPVDRAQLAAQVHDAAAEEPLDRGFGIRKNASVRGETRPLYRKYEIVRRFIMPFGETRRLLRSVIGPVDLDGRQFAAGKFQFPPLRQTIGIECTAPRLDKSSRRRRSECFGSCAMAYPGPLLPISFILLARTHRATRLAASPRESVPGQR